MGPSWQHSQHCAAPSKHKHSTLCSLLTAWSHPHCPADSATLPTPPAQGCPAMAAHEVVQKAPLMHMAHGTAWACSPQAAELPSTAAVQESCEKGEALDPMNCIPASGCTSCSFMSIPSTASFPLNYNIAGEDVTNLKEI